MPYLNSMFGFSYGYILAPTQNPAKHPEKTREKVAEITITHKTAQKYSLFWDLHRAILLTQRETLAAHNCEGTEQLHKIIINSILLLTY